MTPRPRKLALCAIALLGMLVMPVLAEDGDHGKLPRIEDTPKLTVRGDAEIEKPADQVQISIGVVTEDHEATRALTENSELMEAVTEAMADVGLGEDEYRTGRFRIRPQYSRRPQRADEDWKPQIIGYEVTNSVIVKTKQLDLAGEIIAAANEAGANTAEVVAFELAEPQAYRAEVIRKATKFALDDARALADAAGIELVRIIAVNLDNQPVRSPEMRFMRSRAAPGPGDGSAPPIAPGDVTLRAGVTIVYEIAPASGG